MPLTDTELEAVLAADDWPFERASEATWFSAFVRTADSDSDSDSESESESAEPITFFLRLTDDWLFLTIAPFAVLPDDPATATAVLRRLLELNRSINLAKFALGHRAG